MKKYKEISIKQLEDFKKLKAEFEYNLKESRKAREEAEKQLKMLRERLC